MVYTGPVTVTEDTFFRIAAWTEDGGYSERLNLHITVKTDILGDVNADGFVTASDLTVLARHVAKIEVMADSQALQNADVTGDGKINAEDLTHLARYVAEIIPSL